MYNSRRIGPSDHRRVFVDNRHGLTDDPCFISPDVSEPNGASGLGPVISGARSTPLRNKILGHSKYTEINARKKKEQRKHTVHVRSVNNQLPLPSNRSKMLQQTSTCSLFSSLSFSPVVNSYRLPAAPRDYSILLTRKASIRCETSVRGLQFSSGEGGRGGGAKAALWGRM